MRDGGESFRKLGLMHVHPIYSRSGTELLLVVGLLVFVLYFLSRFLF
jgi:hypothetical protein